MIAAATLIAACGSSHSKTAAASNHFNQGLKFSACMRTHGVTNFPDPSAGGGIKINVGSGINPFSPAFKVAQTACRKLLPGPLGGNQHPTAQQIASTRQISECMRQHGVTGFPDPTFTPPSSPAGYSIIEDRGGVVGPELVRRPEEEGHRQHDGLDDLQPRRPTDGLIDEVGKRDHA